MRTGLFAAGIGLVLAGCSVDVTGVTVVNDRTSVARLSTTEAVLTPEGVCEADVSIDPTTLRGPNGEIAPGISECALVRLKGRPTDVLIGQGRAGQRETQVLYAEPGGRELYLFSDNKLIRVIKPGQAPT